MVLAVAVAIGEIVPDGITLGEADVTGGSVTAEVCATACGGKAQSEVASTAAPTARARREKPFMPTSFPQAAAG